jgi:hypothetical protein
VDVADVVEVPTQVPAAPALESSPLNAMAVPAPARAKAATEANILVVRIDDIRKLLDGIRNLRTLHSLHRATADECHKVFLLLRNFEGSHVSTVDMLRRVRGLNDVGVAPEIALDLLDVGEV